MLSLLKIHQPDLSLSEPTNEYELSKRLKSNAVAAATIVAPDAVAIPPREEVENVLAVVSWTYIISQRSQPPKRRIHQTGYLLGLCALSWSIIIIDWSFIHSSNHSQRVTHSFIHFIPCRRRWSANHLSIQLPSWVDRWPQKLHHPHIDCYFCRLQTRQRPKTI